MDKSQEKFLSEEQIQQFLQDGVLVADGLLSQGEVSHALNGLDDTLKNRGVRSFAPMDRDSAMAFSRLSSTNGSGGVLDIFYEIWKMEIALNPKLFSVTRQLWAAAYCHNGETKNDISPEEAYRWHPFGIFDCTKGYAYIDRIGYRLPTKLSQKIGDQLRPGKKKKARPLQRSLTPHLDCCPHSTYTDWAKWRPIQCFVSLTDNLDPNTGGFEAAKGFHREFDFWASNRPPSISTQRNKDGTINQASIPAPCIGQYTHIRPKEDQEIMDRVVHIPVRAGSAVFWDNRIPHANAYKHLGEDPRVVVYCSFLPDVELNRIYVQNQLSDFLKGQPPRDQWNRMDKDYKDKDDTTLQLKSLTPLGKRLMGVEEWQKNVR